MLSSCYGEKPRVGADTFASQNNRLQEHGTPTTTDAHSARVPPANGRASNEPIIAGLYRFVDYTFRWGTLSRSSSRIFNEFRALVTSEQLALAEQMLEIRGSCLFRFQQFGRLAFEAVATSGVGAKGLETRCRKTRRVIRAGLPD
jgi:hypothetical protein